MGNTVGGLYDEIVHPLLRRFMERNSAVIKRMDLEADQKWSIRRMDFVSLMFRGLSV